jgi:hypothetical protein
MSPHHQQLDVALPFPSAAIVLEVSIAMQNYVLPGLCGAAGLARDRRMHLKISGVSITGPENLDRSAEGHTLQAFAGEGARATQTTQLP